MHVLASISMAVLTVTQGGISMQSDEPIMQVEVRASCVEYLAPDPASPWNRITTRGDCGAFYVTGFSLEGAPWPVNENLPLWKTHGCPELAPVTNARILYDCGPIGTERATWSNVKVLYK